MNLLFLSSLQLLVNPVGSLAGAIFLAVGMTVVWTPRETTRLSSGQVSNARQLLGIRPSARITPVGLREMDGFLDDSMQFKFIAYVESMDQIFAKYSMPPSGFEACGTCNLGHYENLEWWDVKGQDLVGASNYYPKPGQVVSIGIVPGPVGAFTVYADWSTF